MLTDLLMRLRALFRRGAVERDLDDELAMHIELQADKYVRAGKTRAEAIRLARLDLGGVEPTKEDARDARGIGWIDGVARDVRYGVRVLARSPAFTAVAVVTLALGIGANTALFSVVNGVLLHPLSYPRPDELVRLHCSKPAFATGSISYPNFRDWKKMNHTFAAMAVSRGFAYTLTGLGPAEKIPAELVSSEFFSLLGVSPVLGRSFAAGEDEIGAAPVVVLGAGFWKRKLDGSREVLGKTLLLDGKAYAIIGVLPDRIDLPVGSFQRADVFVPIGQWNNTLITSRSAGLGLHGIGRLKPGVTVDQARADMAGVTRVLAETYPDVNKETGAVIIPLEDAIAGGVRPYLFMLLGAVGFVLLIACVNVANLLLARSTARARELAIRRALGASRGRVLRQLLTESLLLSVAGGALGLVLAAWGTHAVLAALPDALPRVDSIAIDPRVLVYTATISILAGVLFGLAPAIKASAANVHDTLKQGGRGTSGGRHRAQAVFVVMETAMALVLLVGAGLMVRTLGRLWTTDPGFRPDGVVTFGVSMSPSLRTASPEAIRTATREIDAAIAGTPGVVASSLSWGSMPMGGDDELLYWVDGRPRPASMNEMSWAVKYVVGPGYLDTMGIPLLRGRFLGPKDDEHAPGVVVVDEVFARTQFPGEDAVGKRIHVHSSAEDSVEIVGVVGHLKQWGLDQDDTSKVRAQVYQAILQMPDRPLVLTPAGFDVVARSTPGAPPPIEAIRARVQAVGGENVVFQVRTMGDIVADTLADRRFSMLVLAAFALLALLLAGIGIYGVVAYVVSQRTNEIGIRMALGAGRGEVLRLVLGQGAKMALVGVAIGLVAAFALTRVLGDLLYGVPATDPLTFAAVAVGLTLVALAACYVPARRALRVDPALALRHE
jgi:predicted permease